MAFDLRRSFGTEVPYVDRICRISETPLGSLYSFGVGIEFPNEDEARLPENLKKLETLTERIKEFPLTKKVHSVLDVVKISIWCSTPTIPRITPSPTAGSR